MIINMEPKISIVVPVYNSEKFLDACLNSILHQTYINYEVIVVDDGSLDDSLFVCERYAKEHDQFIFISQSNQGVDIARNNALRSCAGDYIAFLDSDDFVEPEWLQSFVNTLLKYPSCDWIVQGITIDYLSYSENSIPPGGHYESNDILSAYFDLEKRSLNGFLVNKLYKRDIITDNQLFFKYTLKEDMLFNMKYCSCINSIVILPESYYHYVQRGKRSLIHHRYSPYYMKELILSLRDAGLYLSFVFHNDSYRQHVLEDYFLSFSVLLFSMYKRKWMMQKSDRFVFIKKYKMERRHYSQICIKVDSTIKRMVSVIFNRMPICFSDLLFILISPFISKL